MHRRWLTGYLLAAALPFAGAAHADEVSLARDMSSVIALLGLPCGKVVTVVKKAENDHTVTCQDGNRYRVFLNAEGRVVATKL